MKKIVSCIILFVICCYSCSVLAVNYNIKSVKDAVILEKVIADKHGKIENKINKIDESNLEIYGEIDFTNKVYESDNKKQLTEIYIMIPENIVEKLDQYDKYLKYVEEFANKVYSKNMNTKIGIIGIKGTVASHTQVDGKWIVDDEDQGDIPGTANNAEVVAELTDNIQNLKNGLSSMNPQKKKYYTNLQAGIGLAKNLYSSDSNKILISLFDDVPLVCNGIQDSIKRTDEDVFPELVKSHNNAIVTATKNEILSLKNDNISFILLRPDDSSYNQTWYDVNSGEVILEYDGSQHVKDLYGTIDNPTYGKMYSLSLDSMEKIVTQYIYDDVVEKMKNTIENIEMQVMFTKAVYENFNITSLNENDTTIDISKFDSEGKIIWKIEKLNEGQSVSFRYKLKMKGTNIPENILNKNINMNSILISLGDKSSDATLMETPIFLISQDQVSNINSNNNSDSNANLKNDPTIAKENFPKAGKVVLVVILISLIGCASIGLVKMINLKDVK